MYSDTVTLFNRLHTREGDTWYPTVLYGVDLNIDKAAITAKYGVQSQDKAILHVKYIDGGIVDSKTWLPPKAWAQQETLALSSTITFAEGENFDFFYVGEWMGIEPVSDDEYSPNGFFDYMNRRNDYVFAVSSVAKYSLIPHFEITGK